MDWRSFASCCLLHILFVNHCLGKTRNSTAIGSRRRVLAWHTRVGLATLSHQQESRTFSPKYTNTSLCSTLIGFTPAQRTWCRSHFALLPVIGRGAVLAVKQCTSRFAGQRWNCPTKPRSLFRNTIRQGTPESAFIAATEMAGIIYSLLDTCNRGQLHPSSYCGRNSSDASHNHSDAPQSAAMSWKLLRRSMRALRVYTGLDEEVITAQSVARTINNDIGLRVTLSMLAKHCSCHDDAPTCSLSCIGSSLSFTKISKTIKKMFYTATPVNLTQWKGLERTGLAHINLVYVSKLDQCEGNTSLGVAGTRGRRCEMGSVSQRGSDLNGPHQDGSCHYLCCGRGETFETYNSNFQCNCSWKISGLRCKQCTHTRRRYYCR